MNRVVSHPILSVPAGKTISFTFDGRRLEGFEDEIISSALIANGIHIFSHHPRDGAPLGIYCANGQCSQCTVFVDGKPLKACMTRLKSGMTIESVNGRPSLPTADSGHPIEKPPLFSKPPEIETDCLIVGGGPAGLSAAEELGRFGVKTILTDDKYELGGKLTLQTHNFFGSKDDCYAGKRGMDIAGILTEEVGRYRNIDIWLNSSAIGVFSDGIVGVVRDGGYVLVKPKTILFATGAREKSLAFPGCDLPGVYGAGAFQTLVNRDLVLPSKRLFICGGGNVGLIVAYHALQAGIEVAGLAEILPECGGYRVHLDKIKRYGVPVFTSHTLVQASGDDHIESVTIQEVGPSFSPLPGTEKTFGVDTLLIAVGLTPIDELYRKAREYGISAFIAGDAEEIAEAGAAVFSGRLKARNIVKHVQTASAADQTTDRTEEKAREEDRWSEMLAKMRAKPGLPLPPAHPISMVSGDYCAENPDSGGLYPVIHCNQEIPCDPCAHLCPKDSIHLKGDNLNGIPVYEGTDCIGCGRCVLECPGLAIVLVDETKDPEHKTALITLPNELPGKLVCEGDELDMVGAEGGEIGRGKVLSIRTPASGDRRSLITVRVSYEKRLDVAGFRLPALGSTDSKHSEDSDRWQRLSIEGEDTIVCRCERITKGEIVRLIRAGYRDMNHIKALLRVGMGACGGKNCSEPVKRIFKEEGIPGNEIVPFVERPPLTEVSLAVLAGEAKVGDTEAGEAKTGDTEDG